MFEKGMVFFKEFSHSPVEPGNVLITISVNFLRKTDKLSRLSASTPLYSPYLYFCHGNILLKHLPGSKAAKTIDPRGSF